MNLTFIDIANIPAKTKWLGALAIYCIFIANFLRTFESDVPILTPVQLDNGGSTLTITNLYKFLLYAFNYVVIIHLVVNAFNGHPKATTLWVCLAAMTLVPPLYVWFGIFVLGYMLYPFVKKWMSAKFVQAVKSATAADPGAMPPHE
ncbi:MAG: hypothetical protein JSR64_11245 [Nitrospira sp.]|nr:hypothetical protein [Nitrospira sp.]